MNEMYDMSIVTHNYGVIGILAVILINVFFLLRAKDIKSYKRQMTIFTPMGSMAIGVVIFTGIVMMAAKHLDFTIENILMIVFAVAIIMLEVKRAKSLKYININEPNVLENFKSLAIKIFQIEVVLTLSISTWMWM